MVYRIFVPALLIVVSFALVGYIAVLSEDAPQRQEVVKVFKYHEISK